MDKNKSQKKIKLFLAIMLALSVLFYALIISSGSIETYGGIFVLGLMWSPGIAALITQRVYEGSVKGLGWKFGKVKYILIAYFLPLAYCAVVYGITWISGLGIFPNSEFAQEIMQAYTPSASSSTLGIFLYIISMAILGLPGGIISGLGEEIGWRGLFVPELYKLTSYRNTMLISGGIWVLWHLPLILFADYILPGIHRWYAVVMFSIMVMGISFAFGWLRLKSGSLWPAVILHASHNLFIQTIFTPLTGQKTITPYIIDEFGAGMAIIGILIAIFFYIKGKDIPATQAESQPSE